MSIKRILLLSLVVLSIGLSIMAVFDGSSSTPSVPSAVESKKSPKIPVPPAVGRPAPSPAQDTGPAFQRQAPLYMQGDQIANDAQTAQEKGEAAREWLTSPDAERRAEGAEQLGVYPIAEAEQLLVHALTTDLAPEVRQAAADSLESVEEPNNETIAALVAALEDENEDVRDSALTTLDSILANTDPNSVRHQKIWTELRKQASSHRVPRSTREDIRALLEDGED